MIFTQGFWQPLKISGKNIGLKKITNLLYLIVGTISYRL